MLHLPKQHHARQERGITVVELVIAMVLAGIMSITFFTFFNTSFEQYLKLQKDGSNFTDVATQSARIAKVLRGATDIVSESADDITCYAYFEPSDTYVSLIHYYKNATNTELLADVTPMTANPPTGTPITAQEKTYVIVSNFYQAAGVSTFVYLDANDNPLSLPISDEQSIKGIKVTIAAPTSANTPQTVSFQVMLRNRKVNL